ncbi:MAG: hypothetical protein ACE5FT_02830 [Candidatus Nanoarchaeia archaeon]
MLTPYDWMYGIAQLAALFLAIFAALFAISMFRTSRQFAMLKAWKWMIGAVVLFAVEELLGTLKTFGVFSTPHLTHVVPSFVMIFLIAALIKQIEINKGWVE